MNERDIVARLRRLSPLIGDDCAILPNGREDLLVTTDQFIEGVHFRRETSTAGGNGWNAYGWSASKCACTRR
jgi:thiamine monophosphate kinase